MLKSWSTVDWHTREGYVLTLHDSDCISLLKCTLILYNLNSPPLSILAYTTEILSYCNLITWSFNKYISCTVQYCYLQRLRMCGSWKKSMSFIGNFKGEGGRGLQKNLLVMILKKSKNHNIIAISRGMGTGQVLNEKTPWHGTIQ